MGPAKDAFLLCHGSFNPVHRHHVEIMIQARTRLQEAGYNVFAGILAPTNRSHMVSWKGIAAVADVHRIEALRLACREASEPEGWLYCDDRGVQYGSGYKMISKLLEPEFRRERPDALGFDVKGADVVVKYNAYSSQLWYPAVIVARSEATASLMQGLQQAGWGTEGAGKTTFVIEAELPGDYSSTKLREALRRGDEESVRRMAPDQAAEYLLARRRELFLEPGQQEDLEEEDCLKSSAAPKRSRRAGDSGPGGPVCVLFVRTAAAIRGPASEEQRAEPDSVLTASSRGQAAALRDHALLAAQRRPLLVVTSPERRALETALVACGNDEATFVAHPDVRPSARSGEAETGVPLEALAKDFPCVDFAALRSGETSQREEEQQQEEAAGDVVPDPSIRRRLDRFARWCASRPEDTLVVVTHFSVCHALLGVALDHCDAVSTLLDRATLTWRPLAYAGANTETMRWTACHGTPAGLDFLVVGGRARPMASFGLGEGWTMLHYAANAGNAATVRALLALGANPDQADSARYTPRHWAQHRGHAEVIRAFEEYDAEWSAAGQGWSNGSWKH